MENPDADSVDPQTKPDKKTAESKPNPDFIPEIPPPVDHKTESTYSKPDPTPLWKIVLEVGAIAVGIIVAWIYYGQLCVMRGQLGEIIRQYPEIQKSADAARCANALTESNYSNDQRAWIGISLPQKGYQIRSDSQTKKPLDILVAVDTINTGRTPAFGVHGNIAITVVKKGDRIPVGEYGPGHANYAVNGGVMFPGGDMQLAQPAIRHRPQKAEVIIPSDQLLHDLEIGTSLLIVHARIDYLDIRDRPHFITFCRNISSPGLVDPSCMNYNNTDKQDMQSPQLKGCPVTAP